MIRALWTAASGMAAQQTNVDVITNNLANVNTTGFKKSRPEFEDLYYQILRSAGYEQTDGSQIPVGLEVGLGTRLVATQKMFSQGEHQQTDNPMDLAIQGTGFFQVTMPDGTKAYSRAGAFKIDSSGRMITSDGYPLEPAIVIPEEATDIHIGVDGSVSVNIPGQTEATVVGSLELAKFINPAGLKSMGHNMFTETPASGVATIGAPGTTGFGTLLQGALELSNVKVVDEMVNLIMAQRAYEINSKAIQSADEMIRMANNIRG